MAMQSPLSDEPFEGDDERIALFADINITPLTDVILVLLIIFMVSTSAMLDAVREGRLDVNLPKSHSGSQGAIIQNAVVINILKDGQIILEDKLFSLEELKKRIKEIHDEKPQTTVIVNADGDLRHRRVVEVIETASEVGFAHVSIATENDEGQDTP
jgi:biopolymer transport protein ExbD